MEEFYQNMLEACFVLPTYNLLADKQEGWPEVAGNKILQINNKNKALNGSKLRY